MAIGLIINLVALGNSDQQAGFGQMIQFSLNGPLPKTDGSNDLTQIERFAVMCK